MDGQARGVGARAAAALGLAALLSGCGLANNPVQPNTVERLNIQATGGPTFNHKLALEYARLANFEHYEMFDYKDSEYFSRKGLEALDGRLVLPATFEDFEISSAHKEALGQGRGRLLELYAQGARESFPAEAAHAQGRFDCWMEQQEENWQRAHIAACRQEFAAALTVLETVMAPQVRVVRPAVAGLPKQFRIYFKLDEAVLTSAGQAVLEDAARTWRLLGYREVVILGHADRLGTRPYNAELSAARAERIRAGLATLGVPPQAVVLEARGEDDPAVPTADGVQAVENRRVEILLR